MIVFDTDEVPAHDRADALQAAFAGVFTLPTEASVEDVADGPHCRIEVWRCENAHWFAPDAVGLRLRRSSVRNREGDDLVSITAQLRRDMRYEKGGERYAVRPGELALNDFLTPFSVEWSGKGRANAICMSHDALGIPVDAIRAATPNLARSPLYELVRHQMGFVARHLAELEDSPAGEHIAQATLSMVRAMILTAVEQRDGDPQCGAAELVERIDRYIAAHIGNPGLTPAAIAGAHGISVRQLYKLFHDEMRSVEQTIIMERLRAARELLLATGDRALSVTSVAYRVGFQDPSHFARRFRAEFGVSPSAWRGAHVPST